MKSLLILLFTISTCFGQKVADKDSEKIIRQWELKQFENAEKNGNVVTVTHLKYAENVIFEFKENQALEVVYSSSKKETYSWKIKRDLIEISSSDSENFNSEIVGVFEIHFQDKISQLFLQRKNDPHHGIMLKQ